MKPSPTSHMEEAKEAARSIGKSIFLNFNLSEFDYIKEWLKNVYGEEL